MVSMMSREQAGHKQGSSVVDADMRVSFKLDSSFPAIYERAWRLAGLVSDGLQRRVERCEEIKEVLR